MLFYRPAMQKSTVPDVQSGIPLTRETTIKDGRRDSHNKKRRKSKKVEKTAKYRVGLISSQYLTAY